jgi:molybdate transport system substrate-binding protein
MPQSVRILSSMAVRGPLNALGAPLQDQCSVAIDVVSIGGVEVARRLRAGEVFDLAVLGRDALYELAADGVVDGTRLIDLAQSPTALAVREGAVSPPALTATALQDFVGRAPTVGVSTGPSGKSVRRLLAGWGYEASGGAIVEAAPGIPVARLIAEGKASLGFQQLSELLGQPGIMIVGALGADLIPTTIFSAAPCRTSTAEASLLSAVLDGLTSPLAHEVFWRHGMTPPEASSIRG